MAGSSIGLYDFRVADKTSSRSTEFSASRKMPERRRSM